MLKFTKSSNGNGGAKRATSRVAALSSVLLAAAALPLGAAAPAMADAQFGGCTMNEPPAPELIDGGSRLKFTVQLFCAAGSKVVVHQRFFEGDGSAEEDDFLGQKEHAQRTYHRTDWQPFIMYIPAPNTEDGPEEVFQGVSFKVQGWDGRSTWDWGDAASVPQP
jgi:hypothetical protein